jgi:multiple sugar transport system substrate-binding protein
MEDSNNSQTMTNTQTMPSESNSGSTENSGLKKYLSAIIIFIICIALGVGGYFLLTSTTKDNTKTDTNKTASTPTPTTAAVTPIFVGSPNAAVKLRFSTHWTSYQTDGVFKDNKLVSKGLKQYLEDYVAINPDVAFYIDSYAFNEYPGKIKILSDADQAPDIFQIYSSWGTSMVDEGLLDEPPTDIINDVKTNYLPGAVTGATTNGKIYGIPTETNVYALVYNKKLFKEAGIVDAAGNAKPPVTWAELEADAKKLTKKDATGNFLQYGYASIKGSTGGSTDPFLSLLFSNNGKFISEDKKTSLFNSAAGIEALKALNAPYANGYADINANSFDFTKGNIAMQIAAPWQENGFKNGFGDAYDATVGAAAIPKLTKQASLGYTWYAGVTEKSKNKDASWKFLKWLSTDIQSSGTTRFGDLLSNTIGAIPSRKSDFQNYAVVNTDPFKQVFVDQMPNAVPEPNVRDAEKIKNILLTQIEAAWAGLKTPEQALKDAQTEVDAILKIDYP